MSERIESIERYIQGEMATEEKQRFELEMRSDPRLQEDVSRMHILFNAIEVSVGDDLRKRLQQLETAPSGVLSKVPVLKIRSFYTRLAAAAGVLVLISVGLWFFFGQGSPDLAQFSDLHYLPYDYTQMRGEYSRQSDFQFDMSRRNYDRQKAAQWFITWLETHPDDDEARYILADVLKDLGQYDKAKVQLEKIISQNSIRWGEKAEWNYVLLSTADTWDALAESIYQRIVTDPAHSYYPQARELSTLLKQ